MTLRQGRIRLPYFGLQVEGLRNDSDWATYCELLLKLNKNMFKINKQQQQQQTNTCTATRLGSYFCRADICRTANLSLTSLDVFRAFHLYN